VVTVLHREFVAVWGQVKVHCCCASWGLLIAACCVLHSSTLQKRFCDRLEKPCQRCLGLPDKVLLPSSAVIF
jgi:hypothetical protein